MDDILPRGDGMDDGERARVEEAIGEGLRHACMRESQREMVRAHLECPPDPTQCCGSSCDPCVITIARAVRAARRALGRAE